MEGGKGGGGEGGGGQRTHVKRIKPNTEKNKIKEKEKKKVK